MDASTALLLTGIELLKRAAQNNGLYGRMTRLTGHALFALGRAGSNKFIDQEINKEWLKASDDLERDGLSQTFLRDKVVEFKLTKAKYFKAIFAGKSSLLLHKAAREFFRELRGSKSERERTVYFSLGLACLLLAENRYSVETHSLQECLEQKSAVKEVTRSQEDLVNFLSLTANFVEIFGQLNKSQNLSFGEIISDQSNRIADQDYN